MKEEPAATMEVATSTLKTATSTEDISSLTRSYFEDTPILAEIARCESTFRQYNPDGSVLRGKANSADVGVMQVNERYHLSRAKQLGIDIHTLEGNLAYGKMLYEEQGTRPWNSSKACWGPKQAAVVAVNQ